MRLKSPAYGKSLLESRRKGEHPLMVNLVYGDKWWDVPPPKVCIKPEEFEPGKYDFHMLAGLKVVIHDQLIAYQTDLQDSAAPAFGKFFDLLHEVANYAALIAVQWPEKPVWGATTVADIARSFRTYERASGAVQWPRWWSDELDAAYETRLYAWMRDEAVSLGLIERERVRAA